MVRHHHDLKPVTQREVPDFGLFTGLREADA
jgi:hypothetical protein